MSAQPPTLQTPVEILQAALKKEKAAYHFYDTLLNSTTVVFLQELLEKLRDEEHKHVLMIEKILSKMQSGT
jgi:rubrerythrin